MADRHDTAVSPMTPPRHYWVRLQLPGLPVSDAIRVASQSLPAAATVLDLKEQLLLQVRRQIDGLGGSDDNKEAQAMRQQLPPPAWLFIELPPLATANGEATRVLDASLSLSELPELAGSSTWHLLARSSHSECVG